MLRIKEFPSLPVSECLWLKRGSNVINCSNWKYAYFFFLPLMCIKVKLSRNSIFYRNVMNNTARLLFDLTHVTYIIYNSTYTLFKIDCVTIYGYSRLMSILILYMDITYYKVNLNCTRIYFIFNN